MAASSGWAAECRTCPSATGGYGEEIPVGRDFEINNSRNSQDAEFQAKVWMAHHTDQNPGHDVHRCRYARADLTATQINREAMEELFGPPEPPPPPA